MEVKKLEEKKVQLEQQLKQLEFQYHQVAGAIRMLTELIEEENNKDNKKPIKNENK